MATVSATHPKPAEGATGPSQLGAGDDSKRRLASPQVAQVLCR